MSWSYKEVGPTSCARRELRIEAGGIPGMWATCRQAGKLSHLLQYRPAAHRSALWHLTQTACCRKINSLSSTYAFLNAFVYRMNQVVFYSAAKRSTWRIKNLSTSTPGSAIQTKLYSHKAALYSSQHTSPCVTFLRIATIIDDRGEDCYA